jgi:5-hydroxyisourate hydrolase
MISTQIVDTSTGQPATRVAVELDMFITGHGWREVGRGVTNVDGEIDSFGAPAAAGVYRLMFDVASYVPNSFFPSIAVTFEITQPEQHYHVPLILSPFGYSVYLG